MFFYDKKLEVRPVRWEYYRKFKSGVIMSNQISRVVKYIHKTPQRLQPYLLTKLFSFKVKFAATTGIKIRSITHHRVEIALHNNKKVRNHIGGIHAVAAAMLAESSTGIVFGMNVPDDKIPLIKSIKIDYKRRIKGNLVAVAEISEAQCQLITLEPKGALIIPVKITDESGEEPIICHMDWAWVSKKR